MTTTEISNERLDIYCDGEGSPLYNHHEFSLEEIGEITAMARELRDRRAAGGEAVAKPKLTKAMILAAAEAHFGKERVKAVGGPAGIGMTVNGRDYDFNAAFKKMWHGAWTALHPSPDTGKSQDEEGTWSDGGKEWTPEPAQETPKSMHVEGGVHREVVDRLRMEAQNHASEARTANATIYEIYQVLSGATGEPGNWNGAQPARRYVEATQARITELEEALQRIAWHEQTDDQCAKIARAALGDAS